MKKLFLVLALLLFVAAGNAYAVPVTVNIDELYDWGRLYSYSSGVYTPTNTNPPPYGTNPAGGYTILEDTVGKDDGAEDTWGVGSVASIKTFPANDPVWLRTGSQELTLMFYGFDDDFLSKPTVSGVTNILSTGGHVLVYLDYTPDFDGSLGTRGRTGVSSYTGATEGLLMLDLVPVVINPYNHTLDSNFSFQTSSGSGAMFLATTGAGAWDSLYDTNTQAYGSDFSMTFTVRDNTKPALGDWVVRGDAGGEGNVIPEPASMILMGIGLAGAVLRRRLVG